MTHIEGASEYAEALLPEVARDPEVAEHPVSALPRAAARTSVPAGLLADLDQVAWPTDAPDYSHISDGTDSSDGVVDQRDHLAQLAAKDQLIAALTHQLEQIAERLDRERRSGGEISRGLPQELIQQQHELADELKLAVQQWQDLQAGAALGRIEGQLVELRELVTKLNVRPADGRPPRPEPVSVASVLAKLGMQAEGVEPPAAPTGRREQPPPHDPEPRFAPEPPAEPTSEHQESQALSYQEPEPLPEPPGMVDPEETRPEAFWNAIAERDSYIALLTEHLKVWKSTTVERPTIAGLDGLPDAQRRQCEAWLAKMQDGLRRAEISFSLERAALSRERRVLEQQQALKNRAASADKPGPEEPDDGNAPQKRWLRFLRG